MIIGTALAPHEADWLVTGLAVAAFLLGIAVALKNLFGKKESPILVQLEEGFVKRKEFEALKVDVHNQLKDMRAYLHEEMHGVRQDLQAQSAGASEGFAEVKELIVSEFKDLDKKGSVSVAGLYDEQRKLKDALHGEITVVRDRAVAAETKATSNDQQIHQLRSEIGALRTTQRKA